MEKVTGKPPDQKVVLRPACPDLVWNRTPTQAHMTRTIASVLRQMRQLPATNLIGRTEQPIFAR